MTGDFTPAQIRRRAVLTTALAALVVLTALAVWLVVDEPVTPTPKHPPVLSTEVLKSATPEERADRETRLNDMATEAFDRVLPDGWRPGRFDFTCEPTHCTAEGDIRDSGGTVAVDFVVLGEFGGDGCYQPDCTKKLLDDGTLVALTKRDGGSEVYRGISAVRPDSTSIRTSARWPVSRKASTLTDDQWIELGIAFTY